jgi:hypothetical protein
VGCVPYVWDVWALVQLAVLTCHGQALGPTGTPLQQVWTDCLSRSTVDHSKQQGLGRVVHMECAARHVPLNHT